MLFDEPIVDCHVHYSKDAWKFIPPKQVIELFHRLGIERALVSSIPDKGTQDLYDLAPQMIIPEFMPYKVFDDVPSWFGDLSLVDYVEQSLRNVNCVGFGEFHLHGDEPKLPHIENLLTLSRQRGLFLHAHSDPEAVVNLLEHDSEHKVIWAHAGMSSPPRVVRALLDRYGDRLWADLSYRYLDVAPGGRLDRVWGELLTDHSERFLLGSDTWINSVWGQLEALTNHSRRFLAQLPTEVAQNIAYRNANNLFGPIA